jgi:hypothetical protein
MMRAILIAFVVALTHSIAFADTATMRNNSSLNGTIVGLQPEHLVLRANFSSGAKDFQIPRREVRSIEFNRNVFNPGSPPAYYQIRDGESAQPAQGQNKTAAPEKNNSPEADSGDVVILKTGGTRKCGVAHVDATSVRCSGETLKRIFVHSIRLRHE